VSAAPTSDVARRHVPPETETVVRRGSIYALGTAFNVQFPPRPSRPAPRRTSYYFNASIADRRLGGRRCRRRRYNLASGARVRDRADKRWVRVELRAHAARSPARRPLIRACPP